MRRIIALLLLLFGIAHFVVALFALDAPNDPIEEPIEVLMPVIALVAGAAFMIGGSALLLRRRWWRPLTVTGTLLSLVLVGGGASVLDALVVVDVMILVGLARVWISDWDNGHVADRPARSGRLS